jgi:microsomal dipeptidase-like Zn-dependent dipeptidase
MIGKYPKILSLANNSGDAWEIFHSGRIACFIGIEGLHQIGNSFSVLRMYHLLGARYITLAHNSNNLYADSSVSLNCMSFFIDRLASKIKSRTRPRNLTAAYLAMANKHWKR